MLQPSPQNQIQGCRLSILLIAAIADNGVIGNAGEIPWHISEDLRRFKRLTMDHPVIMGRKTYESLGKPLPGRRNIVLTRGISIPGIECFTGLDSAIKACPVNATVFIIGGAEVYRQALTLADALFLTLVHQSPDGDTKFPDYDRTEWCETSREEGPGYSFVEYRRQ
jgi:dihydrofolate reductase